MSLKRLESSPGWHVAEGDTDIRGWQVADSTGGSLGTIDGLLFDDRSDRVVYGIVDTSDRKVLVPVGDLDMDDAGRRITLRGYDRARLTSMQAYEESSFDDNSERSTFRNFMPSFGEKDHVDYAQARNFTSDVPKHIQLLEERLRVGKRSQQVGEVVVTKRPVTETVSESIELKQERIDIERHAVDRPAAAGEIIGEAETIRVPLYAEEAVVDKRAMVKEEITIDKHEESRTETIREDVRREELAFAGTEPEVVNTDDSLIQGQQIDTQRRKVDVDIVPDNGLGTTDRPL